MARLKENASNGWMLGAGCWVLAFRGGGDGGGGCRKNAKAYAK